MYEGRFLNPTGYEDAKNAYLSALDDLNEAKKALNTAESEKNAIQLAQEAWKTTDTAITRTGDGSVSSSRCPI